MEQKLETFLALCQTMHYGRAAELLNLSQPAVSKHIKALETEYGAELFTYSARRLHKTRAGELLEQYAVSLRYNEEKLVQQLHQKPRTLLRMGATKSIGDYILLSEIRRFLAQPGHTLQFLVDNTARLLAGLEAGELDFVILEGIFDKQRYDWFLLREEGSGTRAILENGLQQMGYSVSAFADCAYISSFKVIKELVREQAGVSFLYRAVVQNEEDFAQFYCPPLTGSHELNVVFLKNTNAAASAKEFLAK